jgi:hypothetical protein
LRTDIYLARRLDKVHSGQSNCACSRIPRRRSRSR